MATQTPPIRSGRRVVFLTLDDATGPVDATFFEDVQGPYAATVFHSWLLVVRGELRRTGRARRLAARHRLLGAAGAARGSGSAGGLDAVRELMATVPEGFGSRGRRGGGRRCGREPVDPPGDRQAPSATLQARPARAASGQGGSAAGGMGRRRVLVHSSGFTMSPYADIKPPGEDTKKASRKAPASSGTPPRAARLARAERRRAVH